MYRVIKRDGSITDFDLKKIMVAIKKAFISLDKDIHEDVIELLALKVTSDFDNKINHHEIAVEDIQDSVEYVLSQSGYADVAKAYILYRKQREKLRYMKSSVMNYKNIINDYLQDEQISGSHYSVGELILENSGSISHNFWMSEVYDQELMRAYREKSVDIDDLDSLTPMSLRLSLGTLLKKVVHPETLMQSCYRMGYILQGLSNEWSQHIEVYSVDSFLAPFIKYEGLEKKDVLKAVECLLEILNFPILSSQCLQKFVFECDILVNKELENQEVVINGRNCGFTYGDCQQEMLLINEVLIEVMNQREYKYPHLMYRFNEKMLEQFFPKMTRYAGISFVKNEKRLLTESICLGRMNINLLKIMELSSSKEAFKELFMNRVGLVIRSLSDKKEILLNLMKSDLYPHSKVLIESIERKVVSIGLEGLDRINDEIDMDEWETLIKEMISKSDLASMCIIENVNEKVIETNNDVFELLDLKREYWGVLDHPISTNVKVDDKVYDIRVVYDFVKTLLNNYPVDIVTMK